MELLNMDSGRCYFLMLTVVTHQWWLSESDSPGERRTKADEIRLATFGFS